MELTETELEIIKYIKQNLSYKDIALKMGKNHTFVLTHYNKILTKFDVNDRIQLVNKLSNL